MAVATAMIGGQERTELTVTFMLDPVDSEADISCVTRIQIQIDQFDLAGG